MDHLIPIINKLQDVFGAIGHHAIDLPQIIVVGSQSSGKSSVLESLVGRDFLPRGSGICTRRPLVLQMYNIASGSPGELTPVDGENRGEEWGEFLHLPGQRFYDFSEIRAEIQRETDRITGKNRGISNKTINLKIFSPHVLSLTLVDLPGITKVPTGDQPEDVEEQIRSMCYEFISNPNAIILAVSSANQDLVNSDGLKMARSIDPDGERTIGVLTKVDIMDQGTDCADILANKVVPLRRGYIAVVNRSQKDIQDNIPIRQGLTKEQAYFQAHSKYRSMLSKCGTQNLARSLNQILIYHIRHCLPDIKSRISGMIANVQATIDALGDPLDAQGSTRLGGILLKILAKFAANFASTIDGRGSYGSGIGAAGLDSGDGLLASNNPTSSSSSSFSSSFSSSAVSSAGFIEMNELCGGARISYIFNEIFGRSLRYLDAFEGLDDEDIRTAIANANGPRPALFVPEMSFDLLVRRQIARLESPGLQCVDLVFDEMQRMAFQSETAELSRFPDLRERVFEIVNQLLRNCMTPTQKMISSLISIELAYINTSHPDFIGGKQAVTTAHQNRQKQQQLIQQQQQQQQQQNSSNSNSNNSVVVGGAGDGGSHNMPENGPGLSSSSSSSSSSFVSSAGSGGGAAKKMTVMSAAATQPPMPPSSASSNLLSNPLSNPNPSSSPANPGGGFLGMFRPSSERINASGNNINNNSNSNSNNNSRYSGSSSQNQPFVVVDSAGVVKLPQVPDRMKCGPFPTDKEKMETEVIKSLISSYYEIVKKNFMDLAPKAIMNFLVNSFKENLQNELVSKLYRDDLINDLMRETEDIASKRKTCKEMKELLQRALEIVNEVRDFNIMK